MAPDRMAGLLGLAHRAGRTVTGHDGVIAAVQAAPRSRAALALLASDASERTAKQLRDKCVFHNVPCRVLTADAASLGALLGKKGPLSAVVLTDSGFAAALLALLGEPNGDTDTTPIHD